MAENEASAVTVAGARAPVLTVELTDRLVARFEAGEFVAVACELEGVSARTVESWLQGVNLAGDPLVARLIHARAVGEAALLAEMRATAKEGNAVDQKRLEWLLARLRPSRYRETTRQELTGAEGGPVQVAAVAAEADALMARLHREAPEPPALAEGLPLRGKR